MDGAQTSVVKRALLLAAALVLLVGAGSELARAAAPPPTIKVEVIGRGRVTGLNLSCGQGALNCYAAYAAGTAVTLKEAPATGWTFVGWADSTSGCGAAVTCADTPAADDTATAVFTATGSVPTADFDVDVAGTGGVANGSTNSPIDCAPPAPGPTTCSTTVPVGSTITVLETPDTTTFFGGWGGACSGNGRSCAAVVVPGNTTVSANFVDQGTNTLTVAVDQGGSVSGGGITKCGGGSTCNAQEPATSTVVLTATADSGYAFTGWAGACTGTQTGCALQMNADRSVTANFDPLVPVLITVSGNGTVSGAGTTCGPGPTTCTGNSPPNTTQLLTATPSVAGTGVTWTGCTVVTTTTCKVTVGTSAVGVTATFSGGAPPPASFSVTVDVSGNGYVTSSNGQLWCTTDGGAGCTMTVSQNTSVTLSAVPASGSNSDFLDWSGDCDSFTTTSCTLTMNGAKSVGADFNGPDTTFTLSAQTLGGGSGTIGGAGLKCTSSGISGCSSSEPANATVTISATPSVGSVFTGWGGACTGTSTCRVAMTADKSVTATFASTAPSSHTLTLSVAGAGTVKTSAGTCTGAVKQTKVCPQEFAPGTKVTLTATPAKGQAFFGWAGACKGGASTCALTLSASVAATATFAPPTLFSTKPMARGLLLRVAYRTKESGTLRFAATRSKVSIARTKRLAAPGRGALLVGVKHHGKYTLTLTLTSKTGVQTLHWTLTV